MRIITNALLIIAGLLGTSAAAQSPNNVDSRWLAFLGCWEPMESAKTQLCILPAGANAVDLVTIQKGQILNRERIATGERVETTRADCSSWQTAEWSARTVRVYLRSGENCAARQTMGTGVITMARDGRHWFYIQGMTVAGQTGVRVQRYREVRTDFIVPDELKSALRMDFTATMQARAVGAAALSTEDVVEATQHLDEPVLEAWLVDRGDGFDLDAKQIVALAARGVPSRVTDLMGA